MNHTACTHPFFTGISLETTSRNVPNFVAAADGIPPDAMVNIAYIGADKLADRLNAIDRLRGGGLTPRPIVSARRLLSSHEADTFLTEITVQRGLRRVFLVGGDPLLPVGPFEGAMALIEAGHLDGLPLDAVGLPAYPEGHPVIPAEQLTEHLLNKIQALAVRGLATDITTQICLDPAAVVDWLRMLRSCGIQVPVRIGVPSPTSVEAMLHFCRLCRVAASADALRLHGWTDPQDARRVDPGRFIRVVLEALATEANLAPVHLHLFPMRFLPESLAWFQAQAANTECPAGG